MSIDERERIGYCFINLSNGAFRLDKCGEIVAAEHVRWLRVIFTRLQSTWCEQGLYDDILTSLPPDFYLSIATKFPISIVDCSAKSQLPRALWQGFEWVGYATYRRWFDIKQSKPRKSLIINGYSLLDHFDRKYKRLHRRTKALLDYYKDFAVRTWFEKEKIPPWENRVTYYAWQTSIDGAKRVAVNEVLSFINGGVE